MDAQVAELARAYTPEVLLSAAAEASSKRSSINSPGDAAETFRAYLPDTERECMLAALLTTRNRLIAVRIVSLGGLNMSAIRLADVFRPAIMANAAALVLAHNHPSGDLTPSQEDIAVTRAMVHAGKMLDLEVLDHLILGAGTPGFLSLKAQGLGFE